MNDNLSGIPGWKRLLIAILITADVALLVVGVITIPSNLRKVKIDSTQSKRIASDFENTAEMDVIEPQQPERKAQTDPTQSESIAPDYENAAEGDAVEPQQPDTLPNTSLSTNERPDLEDFLWYTEDVFYNGKPKEVTMLNEVNAVAGGWKGLIIYDPDNTYDSSAMEFLNIDLSGDESSIKLTLDWYLIFWSDEGKSFDETDMEDTVFNGTWENGSLRASNAGTVRLMDFYALNGKQYAIGTMDTPDGIPAYVALVRP